eukprot:TRINITY_DN16874_c0_g1_i1.p1 TRINITY_DN16874_c0_g1~~TRINITY_DN16874_c0_g1_i1.p1  ORF type:complete len:327 (+),score=115.84 TRINITY_DN16874_c0_g1_i1:60-1040(+)
MRRSSQGDPKCRLLVCLGVLLTAGVLLFLLAWTLGSGVQERRTAQVVASVEEAAAVVRLRLKNCKSETLKLAAKMGKSELDVDTLKTDNDLLERENQLLAQTNNELEKSTLECEEEAQEARDRRAEIGQASVVDVIDRMRFENRNLEQTRDRINATNKLKVQQQREQVRAYRMENAQLRAALKQKTLAAEAEARAKDEQAARKAAEVAAAAKSRASERKPAATEEEEAVAPPPVCADRDDQCKGWAEAGECDNNKVFMSRKCRKSCGLCAPRLPLKALLKKRAEAADLAPPPPTPERGRLLELGAAVADRPDLRARLASVQRGDLF